MAARVEIVTEASADLVAAFQKLLPELTRSTAPPSAEQVAELVAAPATDQFAAYDDDDGILGLATLVTFRIPTGLRAWIEDVVVDADARGQGVGEALNRAMLEHARKLGCTTVDLTSRPAREAANRLYQRIGFVLRDTNIYRYELKS